MLKITLPSVALSIRELMYDDGDGNGNGKNKIRKTTILYVHHTFLHIFLPSFHDYDVKLPNFTFYGGRKYKTIFFFFFYLNLDTIL